MFQDAGACWRAMPDRSALTAGRWVIDPVHSRVRFAVCRRGLAPLRARFTSISGHLDTFGDPPGSSVELVVATASIVSGSTGCDLRVAEQLDVARHPTATFRARSTGWAGGLARFRGCLTIVGVTNEVALDVDIRGTVVDPSVARADHVLNRLLDRPRVVGTQLERHPGRRSGSRRADRRSRVRAGGRASAAAPSTSSDTGRH